MMRWHVKLPEGKELWLQSDTPHEDLEKMGYSEYALTDARIIPEHEQPANIEWVIFSEKFGAKVVETLRSVYDHKTKEERRTKSNGRSSAIGRNGIERVREGRAEEAVLRSAPGAFGERRRWGDVRQQGAGD